MELSHLLLILLATSACAKSLMKKRSAVRMEKPGQFVSSTEEAEIYNDVSDADDELYDIYDEILCSFAAGVYPDIEFQIPTDNSDIIAVVDDLKSNIEFAILELTSSIVDHTEVLQETIDYIFHNALAVLLNFTRETSSEPLVGMENIKPDTLNCIAEHLLTGLNVVKANITSNVNQATDQVATCVFEVTSSIIEKTNGIIDFLASLNDDSNVEDLKSEQAFDTAVFGWDPTILLTAQENIEVVFSYTQEAVEIGINLLHANLDESVFEVSEKILDVEISGDTNKAIYILDNTFREQITSLQDLLTEAVSTALIAIVESFYNFAATIKVEILVAAESVRGSSFSFEEIDLGLDYINNILTRKIDD